MLSCAEYVHKLLLLLLLLLPNQLNKKLTFCKLKISLSWNFVYNLQTFWGSCQVYYYDLVAISA